MAHLAPWILCALVAALVATVSPAGGASSSTVVQVHVPSATAIAPTCATGSASASFGTVLPGASAVTSADCSVQFSSSNDTASLLLSQEDGSGTAMAALPTGALDSASFGSGTGKVTVAVGTGNVVARPSVVDHAGRILIASYRSPSAAGDPLVVTRLQADGTLDLPYGGAGTGSASATFASGVTYARGAAVQPDGKVIVVGSSDYGAGRGFDWAIARFDENGALDPSFGSGGKVTLSLSTGDDYASAVLVRPDGRILVSGSSYSADLAAHPATFVQLRADGSTDPGWGSNGIVRRVVDGVAAGGSAKQALRPDGRVVALVQIIQGSIVSTGVLQLTATGSFDPSFDGDGLRELTVGGRVVPFDVAVDRAGRVVVLYAPRPVDDDTGILRLQADGSDDPTWNGGSPVVIDLGGADTPGALRIDRFDNVIATSAGTVGGSIRRQVAIRRLPSGAPDTSFGGATGYVVLPAGDSLDKPNGIHDVDGRIVLSGNTRVGTRDVLYAHRLAGTQVPDWAASTRTWSVGSAGMFGTCLRALSGATATWGVDGNGDCTAVDSDPWRAVPPSSVPASARLATTTLGATGTAHFRFGLKPAASQPAGEYRAPVSFSVVAPAL